MPLLRLTRDTDGSGVQPGHRDFFKVLAVIFMYNQGWNPMAFFFLSFNSEIITYSQELTNILHRVP